MGFLYSTDRTRNEPNTSEHEKYTVREQVDLQTKYAQLDRKFENLELKKIHEVSTSSNNEETYVICDKPGHSTTRCPTLPTFKEVLNGEQSLVNALNKPQKPFNNAFSNTYNPGWRNDPNFSWKNTKNTNFGAPM